MTRWAVWGGVYSCFVSMLVGLKANGCTHCRLKLAQNQPKLAWLGIKIKNEKAAQRASLEAGYPADVHADITADVQGQKLRSNP